MNILQITNLNTHGILFFSPLFKEKMRYVAHFFEKHKTDVICFQEVFFWPHLFLLQKLLHTYPYCVYDPAFHGPKGGLVVFSRAPIKILTYEKFDKRGFWFDISAIDIIFQKGILQVQIGEWIVINTHLSANFSLDWSNVNKYAAIQKKQVQQLLHILRRKSNSRFIVVGDYNFPDNSFLYKELMNNAEIKDIFQSKPYSTTTSAIFPYKNKQLRIDYQFAKSNYPIKVIGLKRLFDKKILFGEKSTYISDHFGLQSKIVTV